MKEIIIPVHDVGFQPKLDKVGSQESVEILKCFELRKINAVFLNAVKGNTARKQLDRRARKTPPHPLFFWSFSRN
jgi:hypothetical protein